MNQVNQEVDPQQTPSCQHLGSRPGTERTCLCLSSLVSGVPAELPTGTGRCPGGLHGAGAPRS